MASFRLLNYAGDQHEPRAGILVGGDTVVDLQDALPATAWARSTLDVLGAWEEACPALHKLADTKPKGVALTSVKLMAPIYYPPAIYCTGANYMAHAKEMSAEGSGVDKAVTQPYLFLKSARHCMISPNDEIRLPGVSKKVDWEAECAVVIGRKGRNISIADAMKYVAGYTIMNDLSARDLTKRPHLPDDSGFKYDWIGQKNFEGACPTGPWITPAAYIKNPQNLEMKLWVDDQLMQNANTGLMLFNTAEQIAHLSKCITLHPGDMILTGTCAGTGAERGIFLKSGQTLKLWIQDIGEMVHKVV